MELSVSSITPYKEETQSKLLEFGFNFQVAPFLPDYRKRYPQVFEIYRSIGIAPGEKNTAPVNPFSGEKDNEDFTNIGEHIIAAAIILEAFLKPLLQWQVITPRQAEKSIEIILVHDLNRVFEIFERKAFNRKPSLLAGEAMAKHLLRQGVSQEYVELVLESGRITSFEGLGIFLRPGQNGSSQLSENCAEGLLARLADDMTCSRMGKHFVFSAIDRFIATGYFTERRLDSRMWEFAKVDHRGNLSFDASPAAKEGFVTGQVAALHMVIADLTIAYFFRRPECPSGVKEAIADLGLQRFAEKLVVDEIKKRQTFFG